MKWIRISVKIAEWKKKQNWKYEYTKGMTDQSTQTFGPHWLISLLLQK